MAAWWSCFRPMTNVVSLQPRPDPVQPAATMTYGVLNQKHDVYDADLYQELHDLFEGGYTIAKRASKYLCMLSNESEARYKERCRLAAYRPYFSQIVEQFASDLFSQPVAVIAAKAEDKPNVPGELPDPDFYTEFEKNVDLQGKPFSELVKEVVTYAMVQRASYVCIDAPRDEEGAPPKNKAEEKARGLTRLYAYRAPCQQIIDWKDDDEGGFEFLIRKEITQERKGIRGRRDEKTETFTVWTMDGGIAVYEKYAVTYNAKDGPFPKDEDPITRTESGSTNFTRVPILRFLLPNGLWVGNKIGPQAKEHWNTRSALVSAEAKSMVTIPYIKRGSEIGAPGTSLPSETQQDPNRGRDPVGEFNRTGWLPIGADDEVGFAEPVGGCYELVSNQLKDEKDEMFRVNHQMAASTSNTPSALGRSGMSKQKDGEATAKVLRALAAKTKPFVKSIYETVSNARGEKNTPWSVAGLDHYEVDDREQVLEEGVTVDQISIPSPTFKIAHKKQLARKILNDAGLSPEVWATIDKEIESGVGDEQELGDIKRDATIDQLQNPPQPGGAVKPPGVKPPAVKPPGVKPAKAPAVPSAKVGGA